MCLMSAPFSKGGFITIRSKVPRLPFCSRKSPQMVSSATCSNDAANVALISTAVTLKNAGTWQNVGLFDHALGQRGRCREKLRRGHYLNTGFQGRLHLLDLVAGV